MIASEQKSVDRNSVAGMSLIELMVSLALGSFILLGLVTLASNSSQSQATLTQLAMQLDNANYGLEALSDDLQHAGFYGQYHNDTGSTGGLNDPCTRTIAQLAGDTELAVQTYNNTNAGVSCVANANYVANTDIVVVRRADSELAFDGSAVSVGGLTAGEIYLQSNVDSIVVGAATSATDNATFNLDLSDGSGNAATIRPYHVFIYFVSPCNVTGGGNVCTATSDDGDPVPTLKRLRLVDTCTAGTICIAGATGLNWEMEALAEGIQNLQLEYGLDTDDDSIPDSYEDAPSVTEMEDIVVANVFALGRNRETTRGLPDTKSYTLGTVDTDGNGNTIAAANDNYRRNNFNTTVRIKNVSMRRL